MGQPADEIKNNLKNNWIWTWTEKETCRERWIKRSAEWLKHRQIGRRTTEKRKDGIVSLVFISFKHWGNTIRKQHRQIFKRTIGRQVTLNSDCRYSLMVSTSMNKEKVKSSVNSRRCLGQGKRRRLSSWKKKLRRRLLWKRSCDIYIQKDR